MDSASRPPLHVLIYGDSGAGKSTSAATFPKPMLVLAFDPIGKEMPYIRRGVPASLQHDETLGVWSRSIFSKKTPDKLLVRVEHYIDPEPRQPTGYSNFMRRIEGFDPSAEGWATVVIDSVTYMELMARKWSQYELDASAREPRRWFAASTDMLEEALMLRVGAWLVNVVVVCHVDEGFDEFHGLSMRAPKAPGRMRRGLPAGYGEMYHAVVTRHGDTGALEYAWQTRSDELWNAATQIDAPNPCEPRYEALWTPMARVNPHTT